MSVDPTVGGNSPRPLTVCLAAPHAYPLFDPADRAPVGGMETRVWMLARGLAERPDCQVEFLLRAPRRFRSRRFGKVRVWNTSDGFDPVRNRVANWREGRLFPKRLPPLSLLWELPFVAGLKLARLCGIARNVARIHDEMDADCYVCMGVSSDSGRVMDAARQRGRPCVLMLASMDDLKAQYEAGSTYRTPFGDTGAECHRVLMSADAIVAQSQEQAQVLRDRFQRASVVLPNPFDGENWQRPERRTSPTLQRLGLNRYILWIGRAHPVYKRPQLAVELACRHPEIPFLLILNPGDAEFEAEVRRSAPANVTIVEQIPFVEMPAVFAGAAALLNTSAREFEGLPNVFLQAAASGVPILSLEVDAGFLHECPAGVVTDGDLDRLSDAVRRAWEDEAWRAACGQAGQRRVTDDHDLTQIAGRLAGVIHSVAPLGSGRV